MLGKSNILFTRSKAAAKRMSSLVLSVFMLQVVAAGFCVTTASATPVQQVSAMEHCMAGKMDMTSQMQGMGMSQNMATHACSHCDMPDVNITFDKPTFDVADFAVDFVVVAIVYTISDIRIATCLGAPPDIGTVSKQLTTFNLNLRIRV